MACCPIWRTGRLLQGRAWNNAQRVFRGQLLSYAFWFN